MIFQLRMKSTPLFAVPGIIARFRCALAANAAPFAAPGLESTPIDRRFGKKDRRSFRHFSPNSPCPSQNAPIPASSAREYNPAYRPGSSAPSTPPMTDNLLKSMPADAHSRYPNIHPDRTKTHDARSERCSGIHRPDPYPRLFSEQVASLCDFLFTIGMRVKSFST